ncbi:MAG: DNA polymerase Y family protein [Phycisphaerae bacterium]|nr:DNA polymerase Y family protein [Phycisphaerae bacterium]
MMVSVYIPWWRAERIARGPEPRPDAVLIARTRRGQREVAGLCGAGFMAGVRPGFSIAHARALLAGRRVHDVDEDPPGDACRLKAMARWASGRWSPIVGVDGVDALLLNVAGCEHLFGGLEGLVRDIERAVRALRVTPFIGAARTVGAAWAVARYAPRESRVVTPGREREAIAPLPVAALRVDDEVVAGLAEVGVERIGPLLELPRASLPARYGEELLLRIDQALGHAVEMIDPTRPREDLLASREIPGGTTRLESVEVVVRWLLTHLGAALARMESGLRRLECTFERLGGAPIRCAIEVSRASRDPRHLWRLLATKIERVHMGFGVERVTLRALGLARLAHAQASFAGEQYSTLDDAPFDAPLAALVDTLASRLGRENVMRAGLVPSHRPERAFSLVPADSAGPLSGDTPPIGERPSELLTEPAPAEVVALSPDGPVMRVAWRGGSAAILCCVGPERLGPEWWRSREDTRDYFRVQEESGRWLWVFRALHAGAWFVHGRWS